MKYIQLMAYGFVIGSFLHKSFRKLSFQFTGKKETVLYIHYGFSGVSDDNISDEVVIILCVSKLVDFSDVNRFLCEIRKCITAPGWSMKGVFMGDAVPTCRWDDDMDGLEKCLMDQHEIDKFKNAYYTMMGPY